MTASRKLGIGIVGAGSIVKERHIPGIRAAGGAEVVAVCNSSPESTRAFCAQFAPAADPMKAYHEVIAHPAVDIVWIGTPPHMHCRAAVAALRSGKHVFCQARMAMDLAQAQEMWEASISNPERVAALCPPPMGLKGDLWMKEALGGGLIGIPHQLVLRSLSPAYLDPSAPPHWRQLYPMSGNQILTLGIYTEVLQRWFGNISAVSAHAKIVTPFRHGNGIEIPDLLHVLCSFKNGIEGSLAFSGVACHAGGDRLEVFGSAGTLIYEFDSDRIFLATPGHSGLQQIHIPPDREVSWTVEADFLDAVRNPKAPRPQPDFSEGLRYMMVVDAVHTSLRSGSKVAIP